MKNYLNFSAAPIYLAPMGRADKAAHRRTKRVQVDRADPDYGPDVEGRNGEPCPKCSMTRILFIPGLPGERWRCCGVRV